MRRQRVGRHRCLTCGKEWRYTTVVGGLIKLFLGSVHVWWLHERQESSLEPTIRSRDLGSEPNERGDKYTWEP